MQMRHVVMAEAAVDGAVSGAATTPAAVVQGVDPAQLAELQSQLEKLQANNKSLLQEKIDAKKAAEKAAQDVARKNGDVAALEESWKEKLVAETKSRDEKIGEYERMTNRLTIGAASARLSSEMALDGSASVLEPHIERRLTVEIRDGMPIVRVLSKDGKPSAMSLTDLRKEFEENPAFAPLLSGSKASGSGPIGSKPDSGGTANMKVAAFNLLSVTEKAAFMRKVHKREAKLVD